MSIVAKIDSEAALKRYAELKKIPLASVLFHAAKDVVQAGFDATPIAQTPDGTFFTYVDPKTHVRKYIHSRDIYTRTSVKKRRTRKFFLSVKDEWKLRKVMVNSGWSRATWIGIMKALDMKTKTKGTGKTRGKNVAATYGSVKQTFSGSMAEIVINDRLRFDDFGRGADRTSQKIKDAGLKLAASRIAKNWASEIRKISK